MNAEPREFASAVILDTAGRLLFQKRDDVAGIVQPGNIGLFGGHRELNETFLQCVVREIQEEISYFVPADRFVRFLVYDGADLEIAGGWCRAEFFIVRDIPADALVVTEGSLRIVGQQDVTGILNDLTPYAQFAMNTFLDSPAIRSVHPKGP